MGNKSRVKLSRRRIVAAVLLVCLLGAVLVAVGVGTADAQSTTTVRIVARKLANDKVEFGLQPRSASGSWGERRLPSKRFFPSDATVGRWLVSSPLELLLATSGSPVRIIGLYLVQNVVGDSRGAAAQYVLSTMCGDRFDEPYVVELRPGRFNITDVFGAGNHVDGVPLAATTARGEACVASAAVR